MRTAESGLYLADEKDFEVAEIKYALIKARTSAVRQWPFACLAALVACFKPAVRQGLGVLDALRMGHHGSALLTLHLHMLTADPAGEHAVMLSRQLRQACHFPHITSTSRIQLAQNRAV